MSRYFFALHDSDKELKKRGAFSIRVSEAKQLNAKGYGIFHTVQSFKSEKRVSENIDSILSYAVDVDDTPKEEQINRIKKVDVEPSRVVETKNGFHIYFFIKGKANPCMYTDFMERFLIPIYDGCTGAKDLSRILRVPGFYHCKNPKDPFMIKTIYSSEISYSEEKLFSIFHERYEKLKKTLLLYRDEDIKNYSFIPRITNKTADEIANALGFTKTRDGFKGRCCVSGHKDNDPSLIIKQAQDKVLVHCFGGCSQKAVIEALRERGLW